ncbi:EF-hand domain-containing protein [Marilutibacter chinensis]|uniref:EF-hand domain-containing protein n=1 Tax=Marilutibacter chinensis TaxID=2912247 RepID=A0ABS9HTJ6_9GAMM|nr:EF-hand domain-containing protein [Lysobacter chinensis]MCF7221407.1 EF-hand domain-containing protein [Lysobacter chinensis]
MSKINHKSLSIALALTAVMAAPLAFAQDATPPEQTNPAEAATMNSAEPAGKSWAEIDLDQDGSISRDEAASVPSLSQVFDLADSDADGNLTAEEYRNYVAEAQGATEPTGDEQ